TLQQAKATGFRPCRRCNPDGPSLEAANAAMVADACCKVSCNWTLAGLARRDGQDGRQ
ncbi:Ada metal-binding domain-containing protein, partial [Mesorhizobium sp.]|uniref:Ada metal-binding domain-containing protein n=1 Tax=Mesorhizobium sp. TaxID=1871066 RepID=UPI0025C56E4B